jgi:hypothetical protein
VLFVLLKFDRFVDAMKTFNSSTPNASTPAIEVDVDADMVKKV